MAVKHSQQLVTTDALAKQQQQTHNAACMLPETVMSISMPQLPITQTLYRSADSLVAAESTQQRKKCRRYPALCETWHDNIIFLFYRRVYRRVESTKHNIGSAAMADQAMV